MIHCSSKVLKPTSHSYHSAQIQTVVMEEATCQYRSPKPHRDRTLWRCNHIHLQHSAFFNKAVSDFHQQSTLFSVSLFNSAVSRSGKLLKQVVPPTTGESNKLEAAVFSSHPTKLYSETSVASNPSHSSQQFAQLGDAFLQADRSAGAINQWLHTEHFFTACLQTRLEQ